MDILSYKSRQQGKRAKLAPLVNEMFKELIRNNKEISDEMEKKMETEDRFMERDVTNKVRLKMATDFKLGEIWNRESWKSVVFLMSQLPFGKLKKRVLSCSVWRIQIMYYVLLFYEFSLRFEILKL